MSDDQAREVVIRWLMGGSDTGDAGLHDSWAAEADDLLNELRAAGLHILPPGECVIEGQRVRVEPRGFEWPADEFPADPDDNITFFATNNAYWGDEQDVAVARIVPVEGGQ